MAWNTEHTKSFEECFSATLSVFVRFGFHSKNCIFLQMAHSHVLFTSVFIGVGPQNWVRARGHDWIRHTKHWNVLWTTRTTTTRIFSKLHRPNWNRLFSFRTFRENKRERKKNRALCRWRRRMLTNSANTPSPRTLCYAHFRMNCVFSANGQQSGRKWIGKIQFFITFIWVNCLIPINAYAYEWRRRGISPFKFDIVALYLLALCLTAVILLFLFPVWNKTNTIFCLVSAETSTCYIWSPHQSQQRMRQFGQHGMASKPPPEAFIRFDRRSRSERCRPF